MKKLVALTGFSPVDIPVGWDYEDTTEGYVLIIDNKQYIAFRDPSDGFRSYGIFIEDDGKYKCKYKFPPQMVWLEEYSNVVDDDDYPVETNGIRITNNDEELILEISTTYYDAYYPIGYMEYHPENLPINKNKTEDFNDKSVKIIAEWFRENKDHVIIGITENNKYIEGIITEDGLVFGEITNFNITKQ